MHYLFDLDGTLVDTQDAYFAVFQDMSLSNAEQVCGHADSDAIKILGYTKSGLKCSLNVFLQI